MARGFGPTYGAGTSDQITTGLTSHANTRSYACWYWRNGTGGGSFGRILDKRVSSGQVELFYWSHIYNKIVYERNFSGNPGQWELTDGNGTGTWYHAVVTYDSTSTSNVPVVYIDGTSITVNTVNAPSGSVVNNSDAYVIGNRGNDSARYWDGIIAEFAVWDEILTADQALALYHGASPLLIAPSALVEYLPLLAAPLSYVRGESLTTTGTADVPHPRMWYPGTRRSYYVPAGAPPSAVSFPPYAPSFPRALIVR